MTIRAIVIPVLVLFLIAQPLRAGQAVDQANRWRTFAEQLQPDAFILVRLSDGTRIKGHFIQVSGDVLQVQPKARRAVPARQVPLTEVASIERQKEGMSAGKKFVIVAVIVVGGLILLWLASEDSPFRQQ